MTNSHPRNFEVTSQSGPSEISHVEDILICLLAIPMFSPRKYVITSFANFMLHDLTFCFVHFRFEPLKKKHKEKNFSQLCSK